MKNIDFNKPIRFTAGKDPAHFVGQRLDGDFFIERYGSGGLIIVDEYGRISNTFDSPPIIENVPELITRWVLVTPYCGYDSKEDALRAARSMDTDVKKAMIRVDFEEGEHS